MRKVDAQGINAYPVTPLAIIGIMGFRASSGSALWPAGAGAKVAMALTNWLTPRADALSLAPDRNPACIRTFAVATSHAVPSANLICSTA